MYTHGWLACVRAFTHVLNALAGIASGIAYPCLLWWVLWFIPHPQRGNRNFGIGMWLATVLVSLLSLVAALLSHYSVRVWCGRCEVLYLTGVPDLVVRERTPSLLLWSQSSGCGSRRLVAGPEALKASAEAYKT